MCIPVGNVTANTEFSFEYGVKKSKSKSQEPSPDTEKGGMFFWGNYACIIDLPKYYGI